MHIQSPRIFILSGLCPRMSQGCVECVCVERERERESHMEKSPSLFLSARDSARFVGLNPPLGAEGKKPGLWG